MLQYNGVFMSLNELLLNVKTI